ncbi:hypothetical protein M9H77_33795 [Catharanthus roseus]|uniref:Uncharacterized protein n=1 Tax=Catharanthus roseus TaxID=4058 RepID=A0ACB9ZK50_CATRO|nr:hypothetical protein M9H77_33795 [Catharanthus roseus]
MAQNREVIVLYETIDSFLNYTVERLEAYDFNRFRYDVHSLARIIYSTTLGLGVMTILTMFGSYFHPNWILLWPMTSVFSYKFLPRQPLPSPSVEYLSSSDMEDNNSTEHHHHNRRSVPTTMTTGFLCFCLYLLAHYMLLSLKEEEVDCFAPLSGLLVTVMSLGKLTMRKKDSWMLMFWWILGSICSGSMLVIRFGLRIEDYTALV